LIYCGAGRPNSLQAERVGPISFDLVAGKMITDYPWGSKPGSPEPKVWHHDILRGDGTSFNPRETALIRQATGRGAPQERTAT
jgi:hypothetical protein